MRLGGGGWRMTFGDGETGWRVAAWRGVVAARYSMLAAGCLA